MEGALSSLRKNAMLLDQPRVGLWYRLYENSNVDPARGMFVSIRLNKKEQLWQTEEGGMSPAGTFRTSCEV
jgi:hypothetical protein